MRGLPQIPAGMGTQSESVIPPDIRKRYGITEDLHQELFDTALFGTGQVLINEARFFVGAFGRGAQDVQITNVRGGGFLLNERQFLVCGVYVMTYFFQRTAIPGGAPDVARLYELFNKYTYFTFHMGDTEKQLIWTHRIPAGGGLSGVDENAGNAHLNQGEPHPKCIYWFKNPYFVGLRQTFELRLRWMQGLAAANVYPGTINPLDDFNLNTTAEKVVRVGLVGIEGRGWTNG